MARTRRFKYRGIDGIPDFLWPKLKTRYVVRYFMWREACHLVGSFSLLGISVLLAAFSKLPVPALIFAALGLWMAYQEFYLHPRIYGQKILKGALDWSAWMLPFALYFIAIN